MAKPKIKIVFSDERLITPSGLNMVGAMLGNSGLIKKANTFRAGQKRSQPHIKNGDVILAYTGMLCQGKTSFESVNEMSADPEYYQHALGISKDIPSAETLRQRMDSIGSSMRKEILNANVEMFLRYGIKPTANEKGYCPLDPDVTPMDNSKTKKEGVSKTYKKFDGYAPMPAYIGTEGYLVNMELRPGKQHCQNHTPEFLRETLALAHRMTDQPLLVRMDAGNDAQENLGILLEDGNKFIIKHKRYRNESKKSWLEIAQTVCKTPEEPRKGKMVYTGSVQRSISYKDQNGDIKTDELRMVFEVIVRTIKANGQVLLFPDIEVNTFWTNLDWEEAEIIESYHAHGEMEQYHSEIKTDMGVERLPSGKFATNELVLELTILAYNILRMIGQESLKSPNAPKTKHKVKRRRLRTVIGNLMLIAGHLTRHGRQLCLALGKSNIWRFAFMDVYKKFVLSA